MQTDYLREFIDLCDTLNFTKSARRLNIAQSTLSRHIMALESDIGAQLFDRSADLVRMTQAGRVLYAKARSVIKSFDDMQADTLMNAQKHITLLRVSGSTIQPTLNRFLSRMQALASARDLPVRFEYTHARPISSEQPPREAVELLDANETDLLIEFFPTGSESLRLHESMWLCNEPLYAFASDQNPLTQRTNLKLQDLSDQSFLLCSMYQHCTTLYEDALSRGGCTPAHIHTAIVDDLLVIPDVLAHLEPNEVSIFQANFAATYGFGDDGEGHVRKLDLHDPDATLAFYLMWRKADNRPAIQAAVKLAREVQDSFRSCPDPEICRFGPALWEEKGC